MTTTDTTALPTHCSFCRVAFEADDERIVHYAAGAVAGVYHDWCRPDRRRSGCGASSCR